MRDYQFPRSQDVGTQGELSPRYQKWPRTLPLRTQNVPNCLTPSGLMSLAINSSTLTKFSPDTMPLHQRSDCKGKTPCVVALGVLPCPCHAYLSRRLTWAHPGATPPSSIPSVGPWSLRQTPRPMYHWFDHRPSRVCKGMVIVHPTPLNLECQGGQAPYATVRLHAHTP
jgi:hypothetical protein